VTVLRFLGAICNFVNPDLMLVQSILDIAGTMGIRIFLGHKTGWRFDDKIAGMYVL